MNNCSYETACPHSMELHRILSPCNPANLIRRVDHYQSLHSPFVTQTELYLMACTACPFETMNGEQMAEHLIVCQNGHARLKKLGQRTENSEYHDLSSVKQESRSKRFNSMNAAVNSEEENLEIEYFGINRMANFKVRRFWGLFKSKWIWEFIFFQKMTP